MRRKKVSDGACNREYFRVAAAVEELFFNCCVIVTSSLTKKICLE
jgi:hypothetical protein